MSYAPIVLFVYNRLFHTRETVKALKKNKLANESELFIFSDAAKNEQTVKMVDEVREYIKTINGFKKVTIFFQKENQGLADSIINGVTKIINAYGKIIVFEDDLIASPYTLMYLNEALDLYEKDERIFVISSYSPKINLPKGYQKDVYLTHRSSSWGWSTWKDEWNSIQWDNEFYRGFIHNKALMRDFANSGGVDRPKMLRDQVSGKINSWAIRRAFTQFLKKKYTIFPSKTLLNNIGFDGSGVHCGNNLYFDVGNVVQEKIIHFPHKIEENKVINKRINTYHGVTIINRIKMLLRNPL